MVYSDYYASESVTEIMAYNLGRGVRNVETVVTTLNPIKAVGAIMVTWAVITGIVNYRRYRKGRITKKQAMIITANESVGIGISAGTGLLADGVMNALFIATTAPVFALVAGVVATAGVKIAWDCTTKNGQVWCDHLELPQTDQTCRTQSVTP
jgi:hypothetical protein